jgi:hypothetical protein
MMVASWLGASCQFLAAETSLGVSLASLVNLKNGRANQDQSQERFKIG